MAKILFTAVGRKPYHRIVLWIGSEIVGELVRRRMSDGMSKWLVDGNLDFFLRRVHGFNVSTLVEALKDVKEFDDVCKVTCRTLTEMDKGRGSRQWRQE